MTAAIRHIYKYQPSYGGVLYAWFMAMHTRVDIILCADASEEQLASVTHVIRDTLQRLETIGSCYDEESQLALLNRTGATAPQPVGDELYRILHDCLESYDRTGGCFDVTVHSNPHSADTIRDVCLSPQTQTLFFSRPGIFLNLSGFLKGYALDRIRPLLQQHGIANALINMGNSSVLGVGNPPLGDGWRISFQEDPRANVAASEVCLRNECLTTSGNDTPTRSHLIHPHTGKLLTGQRKVAVVTTSGAEGEVLSTALFVADTEQRQQIETEYHPRMVLYL